MRFWVMLSIQDGPYDQFSAFLFDRHNLKNKIKIKIIIEPIKNSLG